MLARKYKLAVGTGEPTIHGIPLSEAAAASVIFGDVPSVLELGKVWKLAERAGRFRARQIARYNMVDDVGSQIIRPTTP